MDRTVSVIVMYLYKQTANQFANVSNVTEGFGKMTCLFILKKTKKLLDKPTFLLINIQYIFLLSVRKRKFHYDSQQYISKEGRPLYRLEKEEFLHDAQWEKRVTMSHESVT